MHKNIICIGLYDNELTLLLKLLLTKKYDFCSICSAGMDDYAHKQLKFLPSVVTIATQLNFVLCRNTPIHPSIIKEAARENLTTITHQQSPISQFKDLSIFDLIITPYQHVYDRLLKRQDVDEKKLLLICNPYGIKPDMPIPEAYQLLHTWVENSL